MADSNFVDKEKKILDFWRDNNIFKKSLENRQKAKRFVFFEGPPTANGLPHVGHFLTRIYKDVFGRYKTMRGYFVLRKAGWDTHGLPVEIEVEKELGFKNKKDIETYGIDKFNKKAKESVWKYKNEWEQMTKKMGFWLDMNDPYITYKNQYIESLWAIIKKIWDRKLLYLAHRVVPFCTRCGTPLSSHEVAQGYKTVTDKSVFVKFKVKNSARSNLVGDLRSNLYVLAWTTTPWTLPGNVALAVGKDIGYTAVKVGDEIFILAESAVGRVLKDTKYEILNTTYKGSDLLGLEYEPLFSVEKLKSDKSYRIYDADFVSTEDGTGVVHTAVMYGEDDYNLGTKLGLPKFHTVDERGRFINIGHGLDRKYVKAKETEDLILDYLTTNHLLLITFNYEHDYPFCWRCDTPLLYYAKESWFIKMSAVNKELIENNRKTNWIPEHIKEGRFGQWLKEGKDWAFSRERYWGTPLPIWECNQPVRTTESVRSGGCDNKTTIGSVKELEKLSVSPQNTYYIMRHGFSTRNEGGDAIVNTRQENDAYHLTSEGEKMVEKSIELLKLEGVDYIFSSPFIRTHETASIAGKILHQKVVIDERLHEYRSASGWDGKPVSRYIAGGGGDRTMDSRQRDAESLNDVRKRMTEFMFELEAKYKNKNILIVSHGDPLWLLNTIAEGLTGDQILNKEGKAQWYPRIAEIKNLNWSKIPRNELGELDLHRPYIDSVVLKCSKCGSDMKKVPDLIDVWFDSGAMPYAQWHWPFDNKKISKEQFPADFIVEAIDQTRGWFFTLLAISTLLEKGAPYKNVMVLGHTLDEKGAKMSKSKGNYVPVMEFMDKYGVDVLRWYFLSSMTIGESKSVIPREIEDKQKGFFSTLDNCLRFYELYGKGEFGSFHDTKGKNLNLLDRWILSKLNRLLGEVSDGLDKYDPTSAAKTIEKFVAEDLSNWWLRRSRKRKEALGLLRFLLLEIAKVIAPFIPFMAEDIHMRLHRGRSSGTESVHLHDWPQVNKKQINKELEKQMEEIKNIVTLGLAQRKEKQIKVRQPLRAVHLGLSNEFPKDLEILVKEELNVKEIVYDKSQKELVCLNIELDQTLVYEGYARELMRQIQDMRKEAKYKVDDEIFGQWHSDDKEISEAIRQWSDEIKKEVLLSEFRNGPHDEKAYDIEKEFELAPQRKIWIGLRK
ncbi:MAG: hypothetical protein A2915_04075 [Candidatus Yanofskybacteria bacterium RIFCSPLOWO2_01_FULL_41_34]|uniref:Isoleucine--tRNA ligase n=1 Tax=Candidatus Yanofskybacteria bacterium RIFCSPHIGHO2_01_FULL_41_26 TaxID=1802661 RepID=A0A1F8ECE2_9BACT|nr:MAG: hypothetical protein A2649_03175 [Candidatus Yanofskybacteria bacterium RIFCSPHIGHO2_01_FULL_41_26]OGN21587.1 MAG: hypothetical protein A2915_04075 [Candidatus Yanofskybacteria bacterium RIFCSPLOWO2_01_FULL_41_34]